MACVSSVWSVSHLPWHVAHAGRGWCHACHHPTMLAACAGVIHLWVKQAGFVIWILQDGSISITGLAAKSAASPGGGGGLARACKQAELEGACKATFAQLSQGHGAASKV